MMRKMQAKSFADLVRMADALGIRMPVAGDGGGLLSAQPQD
jgi:hypothetical protein